MDHIENIKIINKKQQQQKTKQKTTLLITNTNISN